tara:strand:+ start:59 stop:1768 length:1710 start_codon:yes stop_codon:yes gene_type:complete
MRISVLCVGLLIAAICFPGCETISEGSSCSVEANSSDSSEVLIVCTDGTRQLLKAGSVIGDNGKTGAQGDAGVDGIPGLDGQNGKDCTLLDNEDGTKTLICGEESITFTEVLAADDNLEVTVKSELSEEDLEKIEVLRQVISAGLTKGQDAYIETLSLSLNEAGIQDDYEEEFDETFSGVQLFVTTCPFVENLSNGYQPTGAACEMLINLAKVESYADLSNELDGIPEHSGVSEDEAIFWYEQGMISGVEQRSVLARSDLISQIQCNPTPTPLESSYDKGLVIGMQLLAASFNDWLLQQGYSPDYPTMTNPIEVCNVNESLLLPARQQALNSSQEKADETPLCSDFDPPTQQLALDYAEAETEYEQGINDGINAEFNLAAVRIFKVIPCNVSDPIVIDMDGDGIELLPIYRGVNFDLYGTGHRHATAWVSPDDALLGFDSNLNGIIDDGLELFGTLNPGIENGYQQLAKLDWDGDGYLGKSDPAFKDLVIWNDKNIDGVSTKDELSKLSSVTDRISLNATSVCMRSSGMRIPLVSDITINGVDTIMGDVLFRTSPHPGLAMLVSNLSLR